MSAERLRAWGEEMREVHRRLRDALVLARESVDDADPLVGNPLLYCWGFCAALSGHHRSEDTVLFPRLAEDPELAPVIARLVQDHSMIEHLIGGLQRALDRGLPVEEKLRHLDGIEAVMESHFRYEERALLDVLDGIRDETVTPSELFGPLA
ncbi:hemerythrin domain-containing protein [Blastococcus haudaquaticus]|uniref:Hemerythrin HHE cation binding domain-containing protein n=1 Tax=Blastococcus haudaquaticus TaxID=1938745 RepID=A0A286H0E1_9ACTN|nr:hemerythrin domain-containing protein [Blastococcus haudaquaticus]SOE00809.1 Hemerythrin HHE cation binding domain-containing protein [Blastococcus haudaquaticus]